MTQIKSVKFNNLRATVQFVGTSDHLITLFMFQCFLPENDCLSKGFLLLLLHLSDRFYHYYFNMLLPGINPLSYGFLVTVATPIQHVSSLLNRAFFLELCRLWFGFLVLKDTVVQQVLLLLLKCVKKINQDLLLWAKHGKTCFHDSYREVF